MSVSTRLHLDAATAAVYVALAAILGVVLVLPVTKFFLRPYSKTARALQGPPVRHWLYGSWTSETYTNGRIAQKLQENIDEYGPVSAVTFIGRKPTIVLADHKAANKVFLQTPYARSSLRRAILRRFVGRGLLTEEGEIHRRQRKIANPAFTATAVFNLAPIVQDKTRLFLGRLKSYVDHDSAQQKKEQGTRINIARDFTSVTLDIIGSAGFGYEFDSLTKEDQRTTLEAAVHGNLGLVSTGSVYSALAMLANKPVSFFGRLFSVPEQLQLDRATKAVEEVCLNLVQRAKEAARQDGPSSARDVLSLMVRANVAPDLKPSQQMSNAELINTVPVLLLAGHETTSATLSFACQNLIDGERGAEIQRRLREELQQPEAAGWQDDARVLDSLPYIDAVVRETLRHSPTVRRMSRDAPYDDVIPLSRPITLRNGIQTDRIHVSKGQGIEFPVYYMNTCEENWGKDGKKWLAEGHKYYDGSCHVDPSVKELKGVFSNLLTFGAGPQMCIGLRLAILEAKHILASLISNYDLLPSSLPGEPPVEFDYLTPITAFPVVVGQENQGHKMPLRIRPVANAH